MPGRPKQFQARPQADRATLNADYDARRGSAQARGYTAAWSNAARQFKLEHPLCLGCEAIGRVMAAELVDHVEPHKGDPGKFWNAAMWQPVCKWHHDAIKQALERAYAKGELKVSDLWLNSAVAVRATLAALPFEDEAGGGGISCRNTPITGALASNFFCAKFLKFIFFRRGRGAMKV